MKTKELQTTLEHVLPGEIFRFDGTRGNQFIMKEMNWHDCKIKSLTTNRVTTHIDTGSKWGWPVTVTSISKERKS